jgi:hypothetical protein
VNCASGRSYDAPDLVVDPQADSIRGHSCLSSEPLGSQSFSRLTGNRVPGRRPGDAEVVIPVSPCRAPDHKAYGSLPISRPPFYLSSRTCVAVLTNGGAERAERRHVEAPLEIDGDRRHAAEIHHHQTLGVAGRTEPDDISRAHWGTRTSTANSAGIARKCFKTRLVATMALLSTRVSLCL